MRLRLGITLSYEVTRERAINEDKPNAIRATLTNGCEHTTGGTASHPARPLLYVNHRDMTEPCSLCDREHENRACTPDKDPDPLVAALDAVDTPLEPLAAAQLQERARDVELEQPVSVEPERRKDKCILPRIVAGAEQPERKVGMLFGGLNEGRRITTPELPLWPEVASAKRVPILDLIDATGLPVMAGGQGAPLPLRLFVRALATVKPDDRKLPIVRLALTLCELRDGLFPNGWERQRDWPKLRQALTHAGDYAIHDGYGRWFPLALRCLPDSPGLDEMIVLDVDCPPGSHSGPVVDLPEMARLSVISASRWRAYIAVHSLAWQPGTTRVRAPRAGGQFVRTRNLAAYPVLTLEDRRRFGFGAGNTKHRTRNEIDAAFRDLPGLIVINERATNDRTGDVGWAVLPEAAAKAVQNNGIRGR